MPIFNTAVELYVDSSRVNCPRCGDQDIEHCFACPNLVDIDLEAAMPIIRCRPRDSARSAGGSSILLYFG